MIIQHIIYSKLRGVLEKYQSSKQADTSIVGNPEVYYPERVRWIRDIVNQLPNPVEVEDSILDDRIDDYKARCPVVFIAYGDTRQGSDGLTDVVYDIFSMYIHAVVSALPADYFKDNANADEIPLPIVCANMQETIQKVGLELNTFPPATDDGFNIVERVRIGQTRSGAGKFFSKEYLMFRMDFYLAQALYDGGGSFAGFYGAEGGGAQPYVPEFWEYDGNTWQYDNDSWYYEEGQDAQPVPDN